MQASTKELATEAVRALREETEEELKLTRERLVDMDRAAVADEALFVSDDDDNDNQGDGEQEWGVRTTKRFCQRQN